MGPADGETEGSPKGLFNATASGFLLIAVVVLAVVGPNRLAETPGPLGRLLGQLSIRTPRLERLLLWDIGAATRPIEDGGLRVDRGRQVA